MKKNIVHHHWLILLCVSLVAAGCGQTAGNKDLRTIDYRQTIRTSGLEVPPGLAPISGNKKFDVVSAKVRQNEETAASAQQEPKLLSNERIQLKKRGALRWLTVKAPLSSVWQHTQRFFTETLGLSLQQASPETGTMLTAWAENKADLPNDWLRNSLGWLIGNLYSTGEKDRFRIRVEQAEENTVNIFISHYGLREQYTDLLKTQVNWIPRDQDLSLVAEILQLLGHSFIADTPTTAPLSSQPAVTPLPEQEVSELATLQNDQQPPTLILHSNFEKTWQAVGLALESLGFSVAERNKAAKTYDIRYIDSTEFEQSTGFFETIAFWRDKPKDDFHYTLQLEARDDRVALTVNKTGNSNPEVDKQVSQKILKLLYSQLN